jgi:hypothetical protein
VGLGSVQNYAMATQAEAEAGSSSVRYMSPLRVKQAIDKLIGTATQAAINARETPAGAQTKVNAHANRTDNPHSVTKAQVGLGSVPNYPATSSVTDGSTSKFATAAAVKAANDNANGRLPNSSYTAADVLAKLKIVDGAGSGLDADLLDGQHGSYYKTNDVHTGTSATATSFPIGHVLIAWVRYEYTTPNHNSTQKLYLNTGDHGVYASDSFSGSNKGAALAGTWAYRGFVGAASNVATGLFQRVA